MNDSLLLPAVPALAPAHVDPATQALIALCLQGDEAAQAALFHAYADTVYRVALWLLGDPHEAEEIVQEVFLHAFRALERYDSQRAGLATWLRAITVNQCRNARRRARPVQVSWEMVAEHVALRVDPGPEADLRQVLWAGLEQLNDKQRAALVLRYFEGLSFAEIAATLECPPGTAASRVAEGLAALRRWMGEAE